MMVKIRSKKVNRAWLHDHLTDPYVRQAQQEGYRARAAYKLKDIDEAERLIRPGQTIVELGAVPGAWSQYVLRRIKALSTTGAAATQPATLIALDMLDFEPLEGVTFIQGDFREHKVLQALEAELAGRPVDLVLSDMAPNLSGIASADAARMADLIELTVDFARAHLTPGGAVLAKAFHGSGYSQSVALFKQHFRIVKPLKPKASRDKSAETFLFGRGLKTG